MHAERRTTVTSEQTRNQDDRKGGPASSRGFGVGMRDCCEDDMARPVRLWNHNALEHKLGWCTPIFHTGSRRRVFVSVSPAGAFVASMLIGSTSKGATFSAMHAVLT